jgi:hypothetical protein
LVARADGTTNSSPLNDYDTLPAEELTETGCRWPVPVACGTRQKPDYHN